MKNRTYINSFASSASVRNLQDQIDDIKASASGAGNAATWAQTGNTDLIPDSKISETFAKSADLAMKADLVDGKVPAEQLPAATVGIVIGEGDNDAFAGSRGVALETKVTDLEATVSDKLGVDDVAVWAKSEDPTLIPVNKLDDHAVKYSDFEYTPSGESSPVTRKTIQLANYDSISGMNVAGNDAANLIMMSKWDKVDIGSSRYPVNLNGSEFTLNDTDHIATKEELASKADLIDGKVPAEQLPEMSGLVIGTTEGTAYDGGKGTELEGKVTTLEETIVDKLGVDDVATWAKSQDPSVVPLEKMDENVVKYSDFSYIPSGESQPVERKTIQLANYDSISGKNTTGDDAANLIMMSKWDKVDIGSPKYPVNLNGSEFTLNDEKHIATTDQIPDVSNFATKEEIPADVVTHEELANYPTKEEMDTAVAGVESKIPDISGLATKEEIPSVEGLASTEYVDQKVAEIEVPDVSDLKANVQTVGESVQIGQETKGINLKTSGDTYSGAMINSLGYIPTMTPYPGEDGRYVLQMRNHDSLSGVGTDGATGGNLAMLSKFDVADFGSKNFHTNLNVKTDNGHDGRVTVNDNNEVAYLTDIPEVIEFNGLTDLETGAVSASIQTAIGLEFADLVDTIGHNKAIFMDRNAAGDYKTCIHATGNISSGNGGANLMFMVGTVPTIYEIQYVNNEWALYVAEYEFAKKSDIPDTSNFATKAEIPSLEGYATTQNVSDSIAAEASAREKAIETATSDLVHNTLTVAGKSLTGNITLASSDLTDGTSLAQKSEIPTDYVPNTRTVAGKALNADVTLYAADIKEKENSADTVYDLMPKIISCPIDARVVKDSYTVAEIFNMFGGATTMTEVRVFADRGVNYLRMANSIGSYQNYMIPVNYYQIPNGAGTTGTIKLIGIGPDSDNGDLITKFTITMTLNGDASTIAIDTKALEA